MWNRRIQQSGAVLVMLSLLLFLFVPGSGAATLEELQRAQEEVESKITEYKDIITSTNREISSVTREMTRLDQGISSQEQEIRSLEETIREREQEIEATEADLVVAQLEYGDRQRAFHDRLRLIYENGQVDFLEVLVESTDMTDFLVRFELLSRLAGADMRMLSDLEEERQELEEKKARLLQDQADLQQDRDALQSSRASLASARSERSAMQQRLLTEKELAQRALDEEERANREIEQLIKDYIASLASAGEYTGGQFAWPLPGYSRISSDYGWRIHPITRTRSMHTGIDIPAPRDTRIVAPANGTVIYAAWYGAYGNCTIIDHGGGLTTMYGHQNRLGVSGGQAVIRRNQIGYVGTTGLSTGNHLHFEVRLNGNHVSPWPYLRGDL